jgi:hypothetical protein
LDKFVSISDVIFKLALAIIAAYLSYQFNAQRQQNEDVKLVIELAFSKEAGSATAGLVLAGQYANTGRIPAELYASIVASANTGSNTALRETANNSVTALSKLNGAVAEQVTETLSTLPVRVYFHISREVDRARAKDIEVMLEDQGRSISSQSVIVPGIQFVDIEKTQSELRCFKKLECETAAPKLLEFLHDVGVEAKLVDLSDRYASASNIRPNHFEVWFGPLR